MICSPFDGAALRADQSITTEIGEAMNSFVPSDTTAPAYWLPDDVWQRPAERSRVLILTTDAGSGHRSAAQAIEAAWQARYGESSDVRVVNPWHHPKCPAVLRVAERSYQKQITQTPELYQLQYGATDSRFLAYMINLGMTLLLQEAIAGLLADWPADIVVSTYPGFGLTVRAVCELRGYTIPHVTVVTDLATVHSMWFHATDALCLAPTQRVAQKALRHGLTPDQVRVVGLPVHPRFGQCPTDRRALREELGWAPDLPSVLVLGGGAGAGPIEDIASEIAGACPQAQMTLVAGHNARLKAQLEGRSWPIPTHIYGFTDQMPMLMHASDVLVTKAGGLSVSEGLACGLPLVIYAVVPGQETGNLAYVEECGAGVYAGSPRRVGDVLGRWMQPGSDALARYAASARAAGRADAADQAAAAIAEVLQAASAPRPMWAGLKAIV
jgi:1,2-diacylglycerol 3-beta-galactosyltransferase